MLFRSELKHQLEEIYLDEELYWQLRSRQLWLKEGDRNTKFFHRMANTKIRKSKIQALEINQELTTKESDIHSHILSYYKDLLGTPGATFAQLGTHFWDDAEKVSVDENLSLTAPFSEQEIYQAVFQSETQGAPGPDGFTFAFYQKIWELVKFDLILLCHQFWHEQLQLSKINKSIICLIPKEPEAQNIKKFRPISLVNCSFKIISKILTYRLEPILQRLIDANQSAFLKNRFILDNVVLSHEIIHHCQVTKQQGVVIKIDFEKAYDKINWQYLIDLMLSRGFDDKWVAWMKLWLVSSQSCITINGQLTPYFF